MGGVFDHFQQFARVIMLAFHHADGPHRLASHSLFNHREEDLLFFHHVAGKLFVQQGQVFRQTARNGRFVGMHALDFGRLQDQLRQLFTVTVMVTHDDVVDDFCERSGSPVFVDGLLGQLRQLGFNHLNVQLFA